MKTRSRKAGAFVVETGDGAPFEEEDTRLPRPRCCLRCGRFLLPLLLGLVASLGLIVQVLVRLYVPVIGGKLRASPARAKVPRRSCLPPEKILGSLVSSHGAREGEGFSMPGAIIWGGSVVRGQDDGLYHMYASRWDERLGHNAWVSSSEVVHATSERPGGPYTFRDVALPRRGSQHWDGLATHNPTVHWHPQRREYLLFYTGITYGFEPPDAARPFTNRTQYELAWNTKRVGVASSASPHGPWRRLATPILVPRHGRWDAAITSNPAALVMRDGSLLLLYKSIALGYPERNLRKGAEAATFHIGAAVATSPRGPYSRLQESPILTDAGMPLAAEDPYIWRCGGRKKGLTYHLVFKAMQKIAGHEGAPAIPAGHLAYTHTLPLLDESTGKPSLADWAVPALAYNRTVRVRPVGAANYADRLKTVQLARLERPQFLFDSDGGGGAPAYGFFAVLHRNGSSRNLAMRVKQPPPRALTRAVDAPLRRAAGR